MLASRVHSNNKLIKQQKTMEAGISCTETL